MFEWNVGAMPTGLVVLEQVEREIIDRVNVDFSVDQQKLPQRHHRRHVLPKTWDPERAFERVASTAAC